MKGRRVVYEMVVEVKEQGVRCYCSWLYAELNHA